MKKNGFLPALIVFSLFILFGPAALSPQGQIIPHNKVTRVTAEVQNSEPAGEDKIRVNFAAHISANSYGRVNYRWFRSDGGRGPKEEVNFPSAGTQTVTSSWTLGAAAAGREIWEAVEIIYPNSLESNKAKFTVPDLNFKVVEVLNSVSPINWKGPCPKTFEATSQIKANGRGTVRYRWVRSDGGTGNPLDLYFEGPGTKSVQTHWTVSSTEEWKGDTRWITVEILSPNHILPRPNFNLATAPILDAAAFGCKCEGYTDNPAVPIRIAVSLSNMGVNPNYNCRSGNTALKDHMWIYGNVTFRNLCSRPLMFTEHLPNYSNHYLFIAVLFPKRKDAINTKPTWPFVYNDPNWAALEIWHPDTLAPNGRFESHLDPCYPCFDNHPIVYVGAIYTDKTTGQKIASNLAKWDKRL